MKISLIAAYGYQRQIGLHNKLLWSIKKDLHHFKKLTWGHCLLMGRKTFDSIGRPLPERTSIVLTRNLNIESSKQTYKTFFFNNIKKAIQYARKLNEDELFVIGGGSIYKELIPYASKLYLSLIDSDKKGDTFFPEWDPLNFSLIKKVKYQQNDDHPSWTFHELERVPQNNLS